jgi:hypothetical protein
LPKVGIIDQLDWWKRCEVEPSRGTAFDPDPIKYLPGNHLWWQIRGQDLDLQPLGNRFAVGLVRAENVQDSASAAQRDRYACLPLRPNKEVRDILDRPFDQTGEGYSEAGKRIRRDVRKDNWNANKVHGARFIVKCVLAYCLTQGVLLNDGAESDPVIEVFWRRIPRLGRGGKSRPRFCCGEGGVEIDPLWSGRILHPDVLATLPFRQAPYGFGKRNRLTGKGGGYRVKPYLEAAAGAFEKLLT